MAEAACPNRVDDTRSDSAAARIQGPTTALDVLRANGYVIFDRPLSDKAVDRLCAERNSWFAATPRFQRDFYRSSHELVLHPLMLSIMDATLGPHCDWYQLNLTQVVQLHAGQRQQATHREEAVCPCQQSGIQHLVTAIWALSDFTEKNGAKLLWPRSHFTPLPRELDDAGATVAEMPRGVGASQLTHPARDRCDTCWHRVRNTRVLRMRPLGRPHMAYRTARDSLARRRPSKGADACMTTHVGTLARAVVV